MWVLQRRRRPDLAEESLAANQFGQSGIEHLDGDAPPKTYLNSDIDGCHTAATEHPLDAVLILPRRRESARAPGEVAGHLVLRANIDGHDATSRAPSQAAARAASVHQDDESCCRA